MVGPEQASNFPSSEKVMESLSDPAALVDLGDSAVKHVLGNQYKYEPNWLERLWKAVGTLKDAVEARSRINSAVAELALLLLRPKKISRQLSRAEIAEIVEPTEEQIEAWAWGSDLGKTTRWFMAFVVFGILALLAFAVVTFGLESPGSAITIIFLSLGGVILAGATLLLGAGLYERYVASGYLSWDYKGYPEAYVERHKQFYQKWGWYAYTLGGAFIALSVVFAIIVGERLLSGVVHDYSVIRLALLASTALGLFLFALGAWPIVRNVVTRAEIERQMGKAKYTASPRLLLTLLPILTGALSLLLNWLFR